jgi:hypothetical protein
MRLSDTIIHTRPTPKLEELSDADGLYSFVQPNGARLRSGVARPA